VEVAAGEEVGGEMLNEKDEEKRKIVILFLLWKCRKKARRCIRKLYVGKAKRNEVAQLKIQFHRE